MPGTWHFPAGFDVVRELLKPLGYATEATLADDSAYTCITIEKLVDAGKKVVVVIHSYSGVVALCAVEDLGFAQRKATGKEGGVINFVYLSAFALPKGMSFKGDYVTPNTPEEGITGSIGSNITTFSIKASHSPFLSVLDKLVEGIKLAAKVRLEKSS
ncbi:hypothetical protein DL95DRAFT_393731 [Leptodontidium sp. 2 PMI_412]|nr:hypothetical protein DL95DRAFT_393731 [Leptodontidium sp. 2 PMI_412]